MIVTRKNAHFAKPLPHPGGILSRDYMEPLGLTAGALAKAMGLPGRQRVERLVREQQAVTADTALRLARVFPNTSAAFWMNLQSGHELSAAQIAAGPTLDKIAPIKTGA